MTKKEQQQVVLLQNRVNDFDRMDLNEAETELRDHMVEEIHRLKSLPEASLTMQGNRSFLTGATESGLGGAPFAMVGPGGDKSYTALFGNSGYKWPDKESNFFSTIFSGRHHPALIKNTMTESVGSDGAFLIPQESAARIHAVALESEIVQPRAYVQPMRGDSIKIPAMSIGSHGANLFGGFVASYTDELGELAEKNPKARSMELVAKKLTGLIRFSSELSADIPGGMGQIETMCGKGLGWYRDRAFLKGSGAGEPLGILNADCVVEVPKKGGQGAGTIIYENLTEMLAALFAGSFKNSIWVCHQSTIPALLTLSIAVGAGGSFIPVMSESNGEFKILTRPCLFTEKTEALGTAGDIMLADFSQYVIGLRQGMKFDTSIHVAFETDEILSRIIERHSGQPLWNEALTLQGGMQVSPFVTLETRD